MQVEVAMLEESDAAGTGCSTRNHIGIGNREHHGDCVVDE
jgi:hypothetical protein